MESPNTWGEAERIIHAIYVEWWDERYEIAQKKLHDGNVTFRAGFSFERRVADALRKAGLLNEPVSSTVHTHFTRDIKEPGVCPACDEYHKRHAEDRH